MSISQVILHQVKGIIVFVSYVKSIYFLITSVKGVTIVLKSRTLVQNSYKNEQVHVSS